MASLNPIYLLSRTECDISTLYYCFFFLDIHDGSEELQVCKKIPSTRQKMDDIEAGLKLFATRKSRDGTALATEEEKFNFTAMTTSDGSRYFAYWIQIGHKKIAGVSSFSLLSFSRSLFSHIKDVQPSQVFTILESLCNLPIMPACGVNYKINLPGNILNLKFSSIEQPEDPEAELIALSIMTPSMIVDAWESIALERKVVVASRFPELLFPCCEFLRRLMLPLKIVNTYIPCLTAETIQTIEAPFPYLVGADLDMIASMQVDLSDSVVVNLDLKLITLASNGSPQKGLPMTFKEDIVKDISADITGPLMSWMTRGCESSLSACNPFDPSRISFTAAAVQERLIKMNISLLSARECTVRSMFRIPEGMPQFNLPRTPEDKMRSMGFDYRHRVVCGWMHLIRTDVDESVKKFHQVWIEMDDFRFSVFEYADELPLLYLMLKDIVSVLPSPLEPEGHVFDIEVKLQSTYHFAASDTVSRREWIKTIEDYTRDEDPHPTSLLQDIEPLDKDYRDLSEFRSNFMATQMVSYLRSQVECQDFESIFEKYGLEASDLSNDSMYSLSLDDEVLRNGFWSSEDLPAIFDSVSKEESSESRLSTAFIDFSDETAEVQDYLRSLKQISIVDTDEDTDEDSLRSYESRYAEADFSKSVSSQTKGRPSDKKTESPPSKFGLMNVPGFKSISSFESLEVGKLMPQSVWPWGSSAKPATPEINAQEVGASKSSEPVKSKDQIKSEKQQKKFLGEITRVTATYRSCEDQILKKSVNDRLRISAALVENLSRSPQSIDIGSIIVDLVKDEDSKIHPTSVKLDQKHVSCFSWILSIWQSSGMTNMSSTTGDWNQMFLEIFLSQLKASQEEGSTMSHLAPVICSIIGFLHQNLDDDDNCLTFYANSRLINQRLVMESIARRYLHSRIDNLKKPSSSLSSPGNVQSREQVAKLLQWALSIDFTIGLECYRLLSGLMHRRLVSKISEALTVSIDDMMVLGSQRFFPSDLVGEGAVFGRELMYGKFNRKRANWSAQTSNFVLSKGSSNTQSTLERAKKTQIPGVLNESFIISHMTESACSLSVILLTKLKEILKTSCNAQIQKLGQSADSSPAVGQIKVNFVFSMQHALQESSAFKSFERDSCQLQMVTIAGLSEEEKVVFWCNIYNILTVHALIQMPITSTFFEKSNIITTAKYNIGGHYFSIIDIEHGILRARSSKPAVFGPIVASYAFADKDPRKIFALQRPCPLISFVLFTAISVSPPLTILKKPANVYTELSKCASNYTYQYVSIKRQATALRVTHVVTLPALFKSFWKDFGQKQDDVLLFISQYIPQPTSDNIKSMIKSGAYYTLSFGTYEWSSVIVL